MQRRILIGLAASAASLIASTVAIAASPNDAATMCRAAIAEAEGATEFDVKLKQVKPRGRNYETWYNVTVDDTELKSYCSTSRGKVDEIITTAGRWSGSSPKRPKAETPDT